MLCSYSPRLTSDFVQKLIMDTDWDALVRTDQGVQEELATVEDQILGLRDSLQLVREQRAHAHEDLDAHCLPIYFCGRCSLAEREFLICTGRAFASRWLEQ